MIILLALAALAAEPHHAQYDQNDVTDYTIRIHEQEESLPEDSEARERLHEERVTLETDDPHDTKRIHEDIENVTDTVSDNDMDCDGCSDPPEPHHDADEDEDSDPE